MARLHYEKEAHGPTLLAELLAAVPALAPIDGPMGKIAQVGVETQGEGTWITVPDDVDIGLIDAVVDAHDPHGPHPHEDQDAEDRLSMRDLAAQYQTLLTGIDTVQGHMDQITGGPANPTAAQTAAAVKLLAGDVKTITVGLKRMLQTMAVLVRRQGG